MKLQLNKKKLKNLSKDAQVLPAAATPKVGGGAFTDWEGCGTQIRETEYNCNSDQFCQVSGYDDCAYTYFCGFSAECYSGVC